MKKLLLFTSLILTTSLSQAFEIKIYPQTESKQVTAYMAMLSSRGVEILDNSYELTCIATPEFLKNINITASEFVDFLKKDNTSISCTHSSKGVFVDKILIKI